MSEDNHSTLRGLIITVVGGLLVSILWAAREVVVEALSIIWRELEWCWDQLSTSYSVPGWVILVSAIIIVTFLVRSISTIKEQYQTTAPFKRYVEDTIHGVTWRWQWSGNTIKNLWCYCPKCDLELAYIDTSADTKASFFAPPPGITFICEHCNHSEMAMIPGGGKDYALGAIQREIRRRIRIAKKGGS